jgi:hypothetical protein
MDVNSRNPMSAREKPHKRHKKHTQITQRSKCPWFQLCTSTCSLTHSLPCIHQIEIHPKHSNFQTQQNPTNQPAQALLTAPPPSAHSPPFSPSTFMCFKHPHLNFTLCQYQHIVSTSVPSPLHSHTQRSSLQALLCVLGCADIFLMKCSFNLCYKQS